MWVVDPLVMPVGAMNDAGRQVFQLLYRLTKRVDMSILPVVHRIFRLEFRIVM